MNPFEQVQADPEVPKIPPDTEGEREAGLEEAIRTQPELRKAYEERAEEATDAFIDEVVVDAEKERGPDGSENDWPEKIKKFLKSSRAARMMMLTAALSGTGCVATYSGYSSFSSGMAPQESQAFFKTQNGIEKLNIQFRADKAILEARFHGELEKLLVERRAFEGQKNRVGVDRINRQLADLDVRFKKSKIDLETRHKTLLIQREAATGQRF